MTANDRLRIRGDWPDRVIITHGWGRAHARPWNDDHPGASLRLDRGGARFLVDCTKQVAEWSQPIFSPALPPHRIRLWREAGYEISERLLLFEHDLKQIKQPLHPVERGGFDRLEEMNQIDREAFPVKWRMSKAGLEESVDATSRALVFRVMDGDEAAGFAIVGIGLGVGYLQRLAVKPSHQGRGVGAALVAACLRWARHQGAGSVLVNTQSTNEAAAALYRRSGFQVVPEGLLMLASN